MQTFHRKVLRIALFLVLATNTLGAEQKSVSNPFEPNPVLSLAKRNHSLCATFGRGAIVLDTLSGDIRSVSTPGTVDQVFPWGIDSWGLIVGKQLYKWDGKNKDAKAVFTSERTLKRGYESGSRIFLLRDQDLVELLPGGTTREITRKLAGMQISELGWWRGRLAVFGNGIYTVDFSSTSSDPQLLAENFWSTTGMVDPNGNLVAGGGGWPALIIEKPGVDGTILTYEQKATYDQIDAFDWDNGNLWIASGLTGEGAIWTGNSVLRSYPKGRLIELPQVIWADIKVINSNVYLATKHGLVSISTDGSSKLYTRTGPWEPVIKSNDLQSDSKAVFDLRWKGLRLLGGSDDNGGTSFILVEDPKRGWTRHELSVPGLSDIRFNGSKIIVSGYRMEESEGGEGGLSGGVFVLDDGFKTKQLSAEPMSLLEFHGEVLDGVNYIAADEDSDCYTENRFRIYTSKESVEKAGTIIVCREGELHHTPPSSFTRDPSKYMAAINFVRGKVSPVATAATMPDANIEVMPVGARANFSDVAISSAVAPLSNPRENATP